jgi:glycosyltransferase involved in cell wall biosynthesis
MIDYAGDTLAYRAVGSYHVGFWFWETDRIPAAWRRGIDLVDEIWVPSTFVADVLRRETRKRIHVIGLPVDPPTTFRPDRVRFGLPQEAFLVLFVADAFSSPDRKNPFAAVDAFREAFGPRFEGVHLALKIGNLAVFPRLAERLAAATRDMPVTVLSENLDHEALWALISGADAYLSLHAAEGLGLTILEAMAAGVPTVVTDYGGSTDFATVETSMPVGFRKVPASGWLFAGHGSWADPDTSQAASCLRRLRDDEPLRRRLAAAGRETAARLSPAAFASAVAAPLRRIGFPV